MSLSHIQVAERWADNAGRSGPRDEATGYSVYYRGETIYSYGSHFPIASFAFGPGESAPIVLFTKRSYSVSTAKHKNYAMRALLSGGYRNFHYVTDPSSRDWRALAEECEAEAKALRASAARRRSEWRRDDDLRRAGEQDASAKLFRRFQRKAVQS